MRCKIRNEEEKEERKRIWSTKRDEREFNPFFCYEGAKISCRFPWRKSYVPTKFMAQTKRFQEISPRDVLKKNLSLLNILLYSGFHLITLIRLCLIHNLINWLAQNRKWDLFIVNTTERMDSYFSYFRHKKEGESLRIR